MPSGYVGFFFGFFSVGAIDYIAVIWHRRRFDLELTTLQIINIKSKVHNFGKLYYLDCLKTYFSHLLNINNLGSNVLHTIFGWSLHKKLWLKCLNINWYTFLLSFKWYSVYIFILYVYLMWCTFWYVAFCLFRFILFYCIINCASEESGIDGI